MYVHSLQWYVVLRYYILLYTCPCFYFSVGRQLFLRGQGKIKVGGVSLRMGAVGFVFLWR